MTTPVLLIHGGADVHFQSQQRDEIFKMALVQIVETIYPQLLNYQNALDAVRNAVTLLEDNPIFNAGTGSKLQQDGKARLSAAIIDSHSQSFSGVMNIQNIKNPIQLAYHLQNHSDALLASDEAYQYALQNGFHSSNVITEERLQEFLIKKKGTTGTVGAIALDRHGHLAAATSTGGKGYEIPGRVSDSATVAGTYANSFGAVSCSGVGEHITSDAVAARLISKLEEKLPLFPTAEKIIQQATNLNHLYGFIAINHLGQAIALTSTARLLWAGQKANNQKDFLTKESFHGFE